MNFGQRAFSNLPTGLSALNTYNLPAPSILIGAAHMAATTYTGTGASLTVANTVNSSNFQPDFVWMKGRSGATDHALYDSVRGTTIDWLSNSAAAETTQVTGLTAFGSTGFTVGALAKINTNAATYVGWQWKGSGTTVSNTTGSITSTVCVNPTAGFSVVGYTSASGTTQSTIGHGLGVTPSLIITKSRSSASFSWSVFHASVCTTTSLYLSLDTTGALATYSTVWGAALPTSSVFGITSGGGVVASTDCLAYCFAPIAGYSAFGSYTGNGSADGPFVFTGFRPRFVMVKNTAAATDWFILDTTQDPYNVVSNYLSPNTAGASGAGAGVDILSNGFKSRSNNSINPSAQTMIYAAFAESPFKNSLAR